MALTATNAKQPTFRNTGWRAAVAKFEGVIFCQSFWTDQETDRRCDELGNREAQLASFRGHKFAHLITTDQSRTVRHWKSIVTNKEEFVTLHNPKLGKHNVLVSTGIDAVDGLNKYVEIKCTRAGSRGPPNRWPSIWLKAKLGDIDRVVMGEHHFTDQHHTSALLHNLPEEQPIALFRDVEKQNAMLRCLEMVLDFMVENVEESSADQMKHYMIEWNREQKEGIELKLLNYGQFDQMKIMEIQMKEMFLERMHLMFP